jgi:hypothetical protein
MGGQTPLSLLADHLLGLNPRRDLMKPTSRPSRRQLTLALERESPLPPPSDTHEALIAALADLLLEALVAEKGDLPPQEGDQDEP